MNRYAGIDSILAQSVLHYHGPMPHIFHIIKCSVMIVSRKELNCNTVVKFDCIMLFKFPCSICKVSMGDEMKDKFKYIGENIRAARKSKNLTIETLSELAGISESFLGTVERGESSLSIETLISICKALGVSADLIVFDNMKPSPTASNKKDTLIAMLTNASDDELDFLIDYVKLYRNKIKF